MAKHTQTIRQQKPTIFLSVFDQFVRLVLKGLNGLNSEAGEKIFCKKVFLKVSQNSQEITCTRGSFLIKLQA